MGSRAPMDSGRSPYGHLLAGAGGVMLAISVFLPWFALSPPQSVVNDVLRSVDHSSPLGQFETDVINLGASYMRVHPLPLTLQQLTTQTWILLLVIGVLALLLSVAALARSAPLFPRGDARPLGLLGAVALGLILHRLILPFNTSLPFDLPRREGGWIALV